MENNQNTMQPPVQATPPAQPPQELQTQINAQVQALTKEEKMLFKVYAGEGQGVKMSIPELRVNQDEDRGERGKFFLLVYEPDEAGNMQKKNVFLDSTVDVVIMRTRFKFGYYDQDAGEKGMELYGTPELDGYDGEVSLWNNLEKKVIFTGQYKAFKQYIHENFPDPKLEAKGFKGSIIKHTEILYIELNGKIHRMYLSKTARDKYWKYKEEIKGVPTFAYKTRLTTVKEKSVSNSYYSIQFEKVGETELKKYIHLRRQLDEDLQVFDEVRKNVKGDIDKDTVKGGNPEDEVKKKWNLVFPENFVKPNCPKCNIPMILRDSFKGPFFGCSDFPNCKEIVKVEDALGNPEALPTINVEDTGEKENTASATAPLPEATPEEKPDPNPDEVNSDNIPF